MTGMFNDGWRVTGSTWARFTVLPSCRHCCKNSCSLLRETKSDKTLSVPFVCLACKKMLCLWQIRLIYLYTAFSHSDDEQLERPLLIPCTTGKQSVRKRTWRPVNWCRHVLIATATPIASHNGILLRLVPRPVICFTSCVQGREIYWPLNADYSDWDGGWALSKLHEYVDIVIINIV